MKELKFKKREFNLDEIKIDWENNFFSEDGLKENFEDSKIKKFLKE